MRTIKSILMERDCMSEIEAEELIEHAKNQLNQYLKELDFEAAMYICEEYFGLEPDYLTELF